MRQGVVNSMFSNRDSTAIIYLPVPCYYAPLTICTSDFEFAFHHPVKLASDQQSYQVVNPNTWNITEPSIGMKVTKVAGTTRLDAMAKALERIRSEPQYRHPDRAYDTEAFRDTLREHHALRVYPDRFREAMLGMQKNKPE